MAVLKILLSLMAVLKILVALDIHSSVPCEGGKSMIPILPLHAVQYNFVVSIFGEI